MTWGKQEAESLKLQLLTIITKIILIRSFVVRIFVGNIPYDATEEQLIIQICEEVELVVSFRL